MNITLFFRRTQSYVAVLLILTLLVPSFAAAQGGGGADSGSAANDSGDEGEQGNPNDSHEGEDSEDDEDEEEEEEKDGAGKNYAGDPSANLGLGPSNPGDPADANGNFQDDSIDQGYDTGDWSGYSDGLGGPSFSGAPSGGDSKGSDGGFNGGFSGGDGFSGGTPNDASDSSTSGGFNGGFSGGDGFSGGTPNDASDSSTSGGFNGGFSGGDGFSGGTPDDANDSSTDGGNNSRGFGDGTSFGGTGASNPSGPDTGNNSRGFGDGTSFGGLGYTGPAGKAAGGGWFSGNEGSLAAAEKSSFSSSISRTGVNPDATKAATNRSFSSALDTALASLAAAKAAKDEEEAAFNFRAQVAKEEDEALKAREEIAKEIAFTEEVVARNEEEAIARAIALAEAKRGITQTIAQEEAAAKARAKEAATTFEEAVRNFEEALKQEEFAKEVAEAAMKRDITQEIAEKEALAIAITNMRSDRGLFGIARDEAQLNRMEEAPVAFARTRGIKAEDTVEQITFTVRSREEAKEEITEITRMINEINVKNEEYKAIKAAEAKIARQSFISRAIQYTKTQELAERAIAVETAITNARTALGANPNFDSHFSLNVAIDPNVEPNITVEDTTAEQTVTVSVDVTTVTGAEHDAATGQNKSSPNDTSDNKGEANPGSATQPNDTSDNKGEANPGSATQPNDTSDNKGEANPGSATQPNDTSDNKGEANPGSATQPNDTSDNKGEANPGSATQPNDTSDNKGEANPGSATQPNDTSDNKGEANPGSATQPNDTSDNKGEANPGSATQPNDTSDNKGEANPGSATQPNDTSDNKGEANPGSATQPSKSSPNGAGAAPTDGKAAPSGGDKSFTGRGVQQPSSDPANVPVASNPAKSGRVAFSFKSDGNKTVDDDVLQAVKDALLGTAPSKQNPSKTPAEPSSPGGSSNPSPSDNPNVAVPVKVALRQSPPSNTKPTNQEAQEEVTEQKAIPGTEAQEKIDGTETTPGQEAQEKTEGLEVEKQEGTVPVQRAQEAQEAIEGQAGQAKQEAREGTAGQEGREAQEAIEGQEAPEEESLLARVWQAIKDEFGGEAAAADKHNRNLTKAKQGKIGRVNVYVTGGSRPLGVTQDYVNKMNKALDILQAKYPGMTTTLDSGTHVNPYRDPAKAGRKGKAKYRPSGRHAWGHGADPTFRTANGRTATGLQVNIDIARALGAAGMRGIGYSHRSSRITHVDAEKTRTARTWGYGRGNKGKKGTATRRAYDAKRAVEARIEAARRAGARNPSNAAPQTTAPETTTTQKAAPKTPTTPTTFAKGFSSKNCSSSCTSEGKTFRTTPGFRNNNPLNDNPSNWDGQTGVDPKNGHATFGEPVMGMRASLRNQLSYERKHGRFSVEQRVLRRTPVSDPRNKGGAYTYAAIKAISARMGIDAKTPFNITNRETAISFMKATIRQENYNIQPYSDAQFNQAFDLAFGNQTSPVTTQPTPAATTVPEARPNPPATTVADTEAIKDLRNDLAKAEKDLAEAEAKAQKSTLGANAQAKADFVEALKDITQARGAAAEEEAATDNYDGKAVEAAEAKAQEAQAKAFPTLTEALTKAKADLATAQKNADADSDAPDQAVTDAFVAVQTAEAALEQAVQETITAATNGKPAGPTNADVASKGAAVEQARAALNDALAQPAAPAVDTTFTPNADGTYTGVQTGTKYAAPATPNAVYDSVDFKGLTAADVVGIRGARFSQEQIVAIAMAIAGEVEAANVKGFKSDFSKYGLNKALANLRAKDGKAVGVVVSSGINRAFALKNVLFGPFKGDVKAALYARKGKYGQYSAFNPKYIGRTIKNYNTNPKAYLALAKAFTDGTIAKAMGLRVAVPHPNITHYHANYVNPSWSRDPSFNKLGRGTLGNHYSYNATKEYKGIDTQALFGKYAVALATPVVTDKATGKKDTTFTPVKDAEGKITGYKGNETGKTYTAVGTTPDDVAPVADTTFTPNKDAEGKITSYTGNQTGEDYDPVDVDPAAVTPDGAPAPSTPGYTPGFTPIGDGSLQRSGRNLGAVLGGPAGALLGEQLGRMGDHVRNGGEFNGNPSGTQTSTGEPSGPGPVDCELAKTCDKQREAADDAFTAFDTASKRATVVPVTVTVDRKNGALQFAREDLLQQIKDLQDRNEAVETSSAFAALLDTEAAFVVDENGIVQQSNGLYAPKVTDGVPDGTDNEITYMYFIEYTNEESEDAGTAPIQGVPYNNADVQTITYQEVNRGTAGFPNVYYQYTVTLNSQTVHSVEIPEYSPVSLAQEQFAETGFTGNVLTLIGRATDATPFTDTAENTSVITIIKDLFSFGADSSELTLTLDTIDTVNLYPNTSLSCPDDPELGHAFHYEVSVVDTETDEYEVLSHTLCGSSLVQEMIISVAQHLQSTYNMADFEVTDFLPKVEINFTKIAGGDTPLTLALAVENNALSVTAEAIANTFALSDVQTVRGDVVNSPYDITRYTITLKDGTEILADMPTDASAEEILFWLNEVGFSYSTIEDAQKFYDLVEEADPDALPIEVEEYIEDEDEGEVYEEDLDAAEQAAGVIFSDAQSPGLLGWFLGWFGFGPSEEEQFIASFPAAGGSVFTLSDVVGSTYTFIDPDPNTSDDEYYDVVMTLKTGEKRRVLLPIYASDEDLTALLSEVGFRATRTEEAIALLKSASSAPLYIPVEIAADETGLNLRDIRPVSESTNDDTSLETAADGTVTYSDGRFAPITENGVTITNEATPTYLYLVASSEEALLQEAPEVGFFTKLTQAATSLFTNTDLYSIYDIDTVTHTQAAGTPEEGTVYTYTITLTDGSKRTVAVPENASLAYQDTLFTDSGFRGDLLTVVARSVADTTVTVAESPTIQEDSSGFFPASGTRPQDSNEPQLLAAKAIDRITLYLNVPVECANPTETGFIYEVNLTTSITLETDETTRQITNSQCGSGGTTAFAAKTLGILADYYGFSPLSTNELASRTFINSNGLTYLNDTATIASVDRIGDDPNEITLEVQVTSESGAVRTNWTSSDVQITNTDNIALRWSADTYDQCLPFLADNGSYSLTRRGAIAMTSGNTKNENFDIFERTGLYTIECSDVSNNDIDAQNIAVTIR